VVVVVVVAVVVLVLVVVVVVVVVQMVVVVVVVVVEVIVVVAGVVVVVVVVVVRLRVNSRRRVVRYRRKDSQDQTVACVYMRCYKKKGGGSARSRAHLDLRRNFALAAERSPEGFRLGALRLHAHGGGRLLEALQQPRVRLRRRRVEQVRLCADPHEKALLGVQYEGGARVEVAVRGRRAQVWLDGKCARPGEERRHAVEARRVGLRRVSGEALLKKRESGGRRVGLYTILPSPIV